MNIKNLSILNAAKWEVMANLPAKFTLPHQHFCWRKECSYFWDSGCMYSQSSYSYAPSMLHRWIYPYFPECGAVLLRKRQTSQKRQEYLEIKENQMPIQINLLMNQTSGHFWAFPNFLICDNGVTKIIKTQT